MREDRTFIGTPGSAVFKLGISGLTHLGSGNSFFEFRDLKLFKLGTSGFPVFKPGISGSGPLLPPTYGHAWMTQVQTQTLVFRD